MLIKQNQEKLEYYVEIFQASITEEISNISEYISFLDLPKYYYFHWQYRKCYNVLET